jgi:hypothetical protein
MKPVGYPGTNELRSFSEEEGRPAMAPTKARNASITSQHTQHTRARARGIRPIRPCAPITPTTTQFSFLFPSQLPTNNSTPPRPPEVSRFPSARHPRVYTHNPTPGAQFLPIRCQRGSTPPNYTHFRSREFGLRECGPFAHTHPLQGCKRRGREFTFFCGVTARALHRWVVRFCDALQTFLQV